MSGFGSGGFGRSAGHLGDTLSALLDGELPPAAVDAARSHLVGCMECAAELRAVSQARTWVRALPPVEPPFGLYERLLLDRDGVVVTMAPTGSSLRRRAGLAALGVAAAAATVLGVGSPQPSPAVPSVPHLVVAHATSGSVGVDLVSKLTPVGMPSSFGH